MSQKVLDIVITGGNRGIGLSLIEQLLGEGHRLHVLCRNSSSELSEKNKEGNLFIHEGVDVTRPETFSDAVARIENVDWLISNAGLLIGDTFEDFSLENIRRQFEVNTLGPLNFVKAFEKKLKKGAKIGILTSRMGSITDNTSGAQYGYRVSKAGANALCKSLAEDFRGVGVTVLVLHPGYVKTDMTGGNGLIETDESAQGLIQLLHNKGHENTGTFWHVNGEALPW